MGESRVGKQIIALPDGVKVSLDGANVTVASKDGKKKLVQDIAMVNLDIDEKSVRVIPVNDTKEAKARHGLYRALIANMVEGVSKGFERRLEVVGIGYKVETAGSRLKLTIGFTNPVEFDAPAGIKIEALNPTTVAVTGIDKQLVGETAARIRKIQPPEPYKGKGIRYVGEVIRKKVVRGK